MRARKLDGQIDQIINIIKTELSLPAKNWITKGQELEQTVEFADDIIKKLNSRDEIKIKDTFELLKSNRFVWFVSKNKSKLLKNFLQKLRKSKLIEFAEANLDKLDKQNEIFRADSSFSSDAFVKMRKNFFEFNIEITKDNNIPSSIEDNNIPSSIEVEALISPETVVGLFQYLEKIKQSVRENKLNFKENYQNEVVGHHLFDQLRQFAKVNENKNDSIDSQKILDMSLGDFVTCLLKTTISNLRHSRQNNNFIRNWNITEYKLLANIPTIIENIQVLTKTTKEPKVDDEIKRGKRDRADAMKFDAVILNGPIINPYHTLDLSLSTFNYLHFKKLLSKRFLPALLALNDRHNKGFIFSFPDKTFFDDSIYDNFILALQNMLSEYGDLLPNLQGVICPDFHHSDMIDFVPMTKEKTIPFITTKKHHIEPTQEFNQFIINQFEEKFELVPKWSQFDVAVGLAGHAFARPGYEFNDKMTEIRPTPLTRCTTFLTRVTGVQGQLFEKTNGLISYEPFSGSWNEKFKDNLAPINRVSIVSLNNEGKSKSEGFDLNLLSSSLYMSAYALIHSDDFDYNEVKKADLCAIYVAMNNSKNEAEKNFAEDLKDHITDVILKKYQENYPLIFHSRTLLTELSNNFQTKNNDTKNKLITYLDDILTNPPKSQDSMIKLYHHLETISNDLKNQEWISFIGKHRLRHSIDEFRHTLENDVEKEKIVEMSLGKPQKSNRLIMQSQIFLSKLSNNFQTKNIVTKNELMTYLDKIVTNSNKDTFTELYDHLEIISNNLKKQERISLFGRHRLRHAIDEFRNQLKSDVENEKEVENEKIANALRP